MGNGAMEELAKAHLEPIEEEEDGGRIYQSNSNDWNGEFGEYGGAQPSQHSEGDVQLSDDAPQQGDEQGIPCSQVVQDNTCLGRFARCFNDDSARIICGIFPCPFGAFSCFFFFLPLAVGPTIFFLGAYRLVASQNVTRTADFKEIYQACTIDKVEVCIRTLFETDVGLAAVAACLEYCTPIFNMTVPHEIELRGEAYTLKVIEGVCTSSKEACFNVTSASSDQTACGKALIQGATVGEVVCWRPSISSVLDMYNCPNDPCVKLTDPQEDRRAETVEAWVVMGIGLGCLAFVLVWLSCVFPSAWKRCPPPGFKFFRR